MTKQTATATMEETKKIEKPRKRWRDEVEEDFKYNGNKKGRQW
jgi:hypothetical protein